MKGRVDSSDFVPTFDGQSALKLPPLKNEAYKDFNMQMTFHPSQGDGEDRKEWDYGKSRCRYLVVHGKRRRRE